MDVQLIPNEEQQVAEEAVEITQPQQQRPPSYTSTDAPVVYPNGPTQPQDVYTAQPQQSYIIQNIPVQQNQGCCGVRSEWFKHSVGMTTGIIQLTLAVVASILSGVAIYLQLRYDRDYTGPTGPPIGATIFIFLPAGILGACSKKKNSCVIVAYLVMSILAAIVAVYVCVMGILGAVFSVSLDRDCPEYFPDSRNYPDYAVDYPCGNVHFKDLTAIHSVIAILMFAEFVVAIVACAICCGGLSCCCAPPPTQQTQYSPMTGMQPIQAQMGTHVVQGSELPAKA